MILRALCFSALFPLTMLHANTIKSETDPNPADKMIESESLQGTARLIESVIDAQPISRMPPKYPVFEAKRGNEGWVKLSFVVGEDGQTHSINVISSSGSKRFESAAIKSIEQWDYEPAIVDGEAIEQCNTNVELSFRMGKPSISRRERKKLNDALILLNAKKYDELTGFVEAYENEPRGKMLEQAFKSLIAANYYRGTGDESKEYDFLKRTVSYGYANGEFKFLPEVRTLSAMGSLFELQVKGKEYTRAMNTFNSISSSEDDFGRKLIEAYSPYEEKIRNIISSKNPIKVNAELGKDGDWNHYLARNSFAFSDVEGDLTKLDVRCKNKRFVYTVKDDSMWTIPEKWGLCQVIVSGDEGARFSLVELSDPAKTNQS